MSFIIMVIRKIFKNRFMALCLLIGMVLAVALLSSIPIYTQAIMQKSAIKQLEDYQKKNSVFPGSYTLSINQREYLIEDKVADLKKRGEDAYKNKDVIAYYSKRLDSLRKMNTYIDKNTENLTNLPALMKLHTYTTGERTVVTNEYNKLEKKNTKLLSVSDLGKHIALVDGKMPSKTPVNGIYEVLVSKRALENLNITLGKELILEDAKPTNIAVDNIKIKPVGVFKEKDPDSLFWYFKIAETASKCFVIDETLMEQIMTNQPRLAVESKWFFALDYHLIKFDKVNYLFGANNTIASELKDLSYDNNSYIDAPGFLELSNFKSESTRTSKMLLSLYIPILIMLCLYICMVSKLIIEREKSEISVLSGRGINRIQIPLIYLSQGLILGLAALIIGPFIGMILVKLVGLSSGFLEFSSRKALSVSLTGTAYLYSMLAVLLSLIMMVIPSFSASKTSIVNLKQSSVRKSRFTLWEKCCLDIILLGLSGYGYYTFVNRNENMQVTNASAMDFNVDPLLFVVPILFIIGLGLFLIRFYPIFIRLIHWAGRKFWPVEIHIPLNQVSRSLRSYHFLIIFLIMTLSMGIFSATADRTINRNLEEKILYKNGSDLVVCPTWQKADSSGAILPRNMVRNAFVVDLINDPDDTFYQFLEPNFSAYKKIDGVESAARVFYWNGICVKSKLSLPGSAKIMGIDTDDFAKTAWFRKGLLKYNFYYYLGLLSSDRNACLISKQLSKSMELKVGDTIQVARPEDKNHPLGNLTIYGIIDYWPSWNPLAPNDFNPEGTSPELIIANLDYMQDLYHVKPYDIWLKLKPDASVEQVYKDIEKKKLPITNITNSIQEISDKKNEPNTLTINGSLTLGFIISGLVCFLGFLIYWILSIKSRTLQFGIFRAMGLPLKRLVFMALFEQIIISAVASIIGVVIGLITTKLFVPFFQLSLDANSQVPPFRVVAYKGDRMEIYIMVGFMIVSCMLIIGFILSRIKANQAIKLGEE